jgi:uncharacterized membrane protein YeaQ/YmgE (transglycosylase-associated protein family)
MAGLIWIVIVGLVAGFVARLIAPGPNKPSRFLLTRALGIAGAVLATFVGQAVGWYRADQGAGFIAATLGAVALCLEPLGGKWLTSRSWRLNRR